MEFIPLEQTRQQMICPFCKGNEDETPNEIAAYRSDGSTMASDEDPTRWAVRVVPNKYPSFAQEDSVTGNGAPALAPQTGSATNGAFRTTPCTGVQELIIPSSRHISSISELTDNELCLSFRVYQDRLARLKELEYIKHAMLFMNCRLRAGASLGHIHTQLIGSPVVSSHLKRRVDRNIAHFQQHGISLVESVAKWEIEEEIRIISVTDNFCIVCPFASRFAFQVWIIPLKHQTDFLNCSSEMRDELARHCQTLVGRMESLMDQPAYNLMLHTGPFTDSLNGHWYFELFPRLTRVAGFEWGTDIWINPVPPSVAARQLRVQT